MAILSTTNININGNEIPYYSSCSLNQEIGEHHEMQLYCLLETIEKFCSESNEEIESLLGSSITIETKSFANINFHGTLKFKGIITELNFKKGLYASEGDYIIIVAKSPGIISDDGTHYTSYSDMSFIDIMQKNFSDYDSSILKINTKNSKHTNPLLYTVQSKESCFQFAQRMASRNGEWFYYNGEELVFGLDNNTKELELKLGRDLYDYNTKLSPLPQNFDYFTNNYLEDTIHQKKSNANNTSNNGYFNTVNDNSKGMYSKKTKVWVNVQDNPSSKSQLDNSVSLQQKAIESNQIKITASSDNPGVKLTTIVKIMNSSYRVIKVDHTYSSTGEYKNYFEAISINVDAYPKTNILAYAKSESQLAKVVENTDPKNLGRIQVQFPWQKAEGLTSPWIRIVNPHAGTDKGFYFIPEKHEEVLIGFEGGNTEKPYVIGSMYNNSEKANAFQSNDNSIKAIKTRSGHILRFTEDESIILTDKSGNKLHFDTTGKNITVTAPETMTFNCKNMVVNVDENMTTNVGRNKSDTVGMNSNENTGMMKSTTVGMNASMMVMGNLMEFIQGNLTSEVVKGREESAAEVKVTSNSGNISKNASGQVQNNSGEKGNNF